MNADAADLTPILHSFLDRIRLATKAERPARIAELMQYVDVTGSPLLLNETTAAFLYRGPGDDVRIIGDMTHWSSEISLDRVSDTDLWVHIGNLPTAARIEYQLLVDDASTSDPGCPDRVLNGLGANSELAMPGYLRRPIFESVRDGTKGTFERVERVDVSAGILGYAQEMHVYTPPGYAGPHDTSHETTVASRCPTVYILDGSDYIEYAHTPAVLDHLIVGRQIQPVIAVFVSPPHRHQPEEPNRTTEYGLNADYARFMSEELVPLIDARYRTCASPSTRLVAGDSYAGLAAAYIPFAYPQIFGLGYSQSGYLSFQSDALIKSYDAAQRQPIRLFVDVGHYERTVGSGWLPEEEMDFVAANRRFRAVLENRGYDVAYCEYPEGHTWGNWRAHLMDALVHFWGAR